jgi:hypothetical protein
MDRIDLAQNRDRWEALVNTVMKLRGPQNFVKSLSSCTTGGLLEGLSSLELVFLPGYKPDRPARKLVAIPTELSEIVDQK